MLLDDATAAQMPLLLANAAAAAVAYVVATTGHARPHATGIHVFLLSCFEFHSQKFVVMLKVRRHA